MNSAFQREQLVFTSPLATVSTFRCKHPRDRTGYDQNNPTHAILFVRSGAFGRIAGSVREIADPTLVLFAQPETTYRYFHPADCGDDCIIIRPSLAALSRIPEGALSSIQSCFARTSALVSPRSGLLVSELLQRLRLAEPSICIEEILLQIIHDLGCQIPDRAFHRGHHDKILSRRHRRDLAEDIKLLVVQMFPESPGLNDLSLTLDHSPNYISRVFASECGISLRQYITRLRLRTATTMIEQGISNLSTIGVECGFYDQSHFTREFVKFYKISPASYRRTLGLR